MLSWKLWIIASSSDNEGVSSHVVDFDTVDEAEAAYKAVQRADQEEDQYAQVDAVRLYEAPLTPG